MVTKVTHKNKKNKKKMIDNGTLLAGEEWWRLMVKNGSNGKVVIGGARRFGPENIPNRRVRCRWAQWRSGGAYPREM